MIVTRTKDDFLAFARAHAAESRDYTIETGRPVYLPFCEKADGPEFFTSGMAFEMLHGTDANKRHVVTLMYGKVDASGEVGFHFVCGDTFLTGRNKGGRAGAEERIGLAMREAGAPADARKRMLDSFGLFQPDSACGFWRNGLRRDPNGPGCKHVQGVLYQLTQQGILEQSLDGMVANYDMALGGGAPAAAGCGDLRDDFALLAKPGVAGFPLKIEGESGMGKTFAAREHAKTFEHYEEVEGMEGLETLDFLGANLPHAGGTVWVDGPVTRAFRMAASGKNTLLFIDELLRIPRRERSLFLTALTPHDGFYRLRTGRLTNVTNGVAEMEMLRAPVTKLTVMAATNSGDDYDVENEDRAGMERWLTIVYCPTEVHIHDVLTKIAAARGVDAGEVPKLVRFRENCRKLKADHQCREIPSLRLLARAINLASGAMGVRKSAEFLIPSLVGRSPEGSVNVTQAKAVLGALSHAFV